LPWSDCQKSPAALLTRGPKGVTFVPLVRLSKVACGAFDAGPERRDFRSPSVADCLRHHARRAVGAAARPFSLSDGQKSPAALLTRRPKGVTFVRLVRWSKVACGAFDAGPERRDFRSP